MMAHHSGNKIDLQCDYLKANAVVVAGGLTCGGQLNAGAMVCTSPATTANQLLRYGDVFQTTVSTTLYGNWYLSGDTMITGAQSIYLYRIGNVVYARSNQTMLGIGSTDVSSSNMSYTPSLPAVFAQTNVARLDVPVVVFYDIVPTCTVSWSGHMSVGSTLSISLLSAAQIDVGYYLSPYLWTASWPV